LKGTHRNFKAHTKYAPWRLARLMLYFILMLPMALSVLLVTASSADDGKPLVYVISIESHIERGLQAFMERAFKEARDAEADHILMEMNTFGGAVDAASGIGRLISGETIPTTVFVNNDAVSAGAYIALNADSILMTPTANIGAATVVDSTGTAGEAKAMSMWTAAMAAAAEKNNRDPLYARAMVNMEIEIEGLTSVGSPLSFSAQQALQYGYAEAIVNNRQEALQFLGLENARVVETELSFAERIARFVTSPIIMPILFSLGSLGLVLELYSPGFGVPGTIGLTALTLFFFGHLIAGFAGWESIFLFILGVTLVLIELFVLPGFGIFGILGIVSVVGSLTMASFDVMTGLRAVSIAILITIVGVFLIFYYYGKSKKPSRLVLGEDLYNEEGNEQFQKKSSLIGKEGITLTKLRPAGVVRIENEKYDVVSDGGFIDINEKVIVTNVHGTRILVSHIPDET